MKGGDEVRLRHIRDAACEAVAFLHEASPDAVRENRMLELALVKAVEIVGEAAHYVSDAVKEKMPEVEWHKINGMRNRLVHDYFEIDYDLLRWTVENDFPPLVERIDRYLAGLDGDDSSQAE